jgi:lysophospholipase L1-like esterase
MDGDADGGGSAAGRLARAALALLSLILSLGLLEGLLRLATPRTLFLERHTETFWKLRFEQAAHALPRRADYARDIEYDPLLGWRMRPLYRAGDVAHNARGARGARDHALVGAAPGRRIAAVGDSFTYGLGVSDSAAYPSRLEALLPGWEVINLGVNGYGIDQQLLMWETEGVRYGARIALLGLFHEDFHRAAVQFWGYPKPKFEVDGDRLRLTGVPVPRLEELRSEGADWIPDRLRLLEALEFGVRRAARLAGVDRGSDQFEQRARLAELLLRRFRDSALAAGARPVVVFIPDSRYRRAREAQRIESAVAAACRTHAIPYVDLTDALAAGEDPRRGGVYDPANGHWTPRGHELAAWRIAGFLRESKLLD